MKYLAGIGKGKAPVFTPGNASVGTLVFEAPFNEVGGANILLVINTTTNDVIYNKNNTDYDGTFSGGGSTGLTLTLDRDTSSFNLSDDLHAWVNVKDGAAGIDFMSELAVKDMSYAAMKNIELSTENVNFDMTNQTTLQQTTVDKLTELLAVPDTFFLDTGDEALIGSNLGVDLTGDYTKIISVRSMHDDTAISLGTTQSPGNDILNTYALPNHDFIDTSFDYITVGGTAGKVLITVIK